MPATPDISPRLSTFGACFAFAIAVEADNAGHITPIVNIRHMLCVACDRSGCRQRRTCHPIVNACRMFNARHRLCDLLPVARHYCRFFAHRKLTNVRHFGVRNGDKFHSLTSVYGLVCSLALKTGPAFATFGSYVTSKFAQTGLTYQVCWVICLFSSSDVSVNFSSHGNVPGQAHTSNLHSVFFV